MEISYSRLNAYLECPWLYKIIYVDGRRPRPTPRSSLGLTVHRCLEQFYREDGSTFQRLLELYDETWVHEGFSSVQEQMELYEEGRGILKKYWKMEVQRKSRVAFVEREFEFPLGSHVVRGIIDRVDLRPDGAYEVVEYKSQQDVLDCQRVSDNLQLQLYGLALREAFGIEPSWLSMVFVSRGESVTVPYDSGRESGLKEFLVQVAGRIEAGDFAPDTRHCRACEFKDGHPLCPHSARQEKKD